MVNRGLVGCIAPHISEDGVGVIIKVEFFNVFLFLFLNLIFHFCSFVTCLFVTGSLYSGRINSSWFNQFHDLQGRGNLSLASVSLLGENNNNDDPNDKKTKSQY